jgi:hypothetical protein
MNEAIHDLLGGWSDFYLIVGSAAAALTGLQFVVQTLIASDSQRAMAGPDTEWGISAFGTPTVVHFSQALIISASMCVPWLGFTLLRVFLGVVGACALLYAVVVLGRAKAQKGYVPELEDWVFHVVLPIVAYGSVLAGAVGLGADAEWPPFVIAAAALLLVCIGIHNAWDTVTFLTINVLRNGTVHTAPAPPRPSAPKPRQARRR